MCSEGGMKELARPPLRHVLSTLSEQDYGLTKSTSFCDSLGSEIQWLLG